MADLSDAPELIDPTSGLLAHAGPRTRLDDAMGVAALRKLIVERFGVTAARTTLTQLGFTDGWRLAKATYPPTAPGISNDSEPDGGVLDADDDWRAGGFYLHSIAGRYLVAPGSSGVLSATGVTLIWSYEAEQQLLHFGVSDAPACWILCGLVAGYSSRALGKEVHVVEDRCVAKGDATCRLVGRVRPGRAGTRHEPAAVDRGRSDASLALALRGVMESLEDAERRQRERRSSIPVAPEVQIEGIVAKSAAMREVVDLARRVASVDSTVLITGESGAGKERISLLVHAESPRASGPFVAVNCGAISETLLESELFGHARGAFTGASQDHEGLFEAANHGTLLLDEIGEVSTGMQVKLLRALQEHEVRRVGETRTRSVDVRVIAATNRNLEQRVREGSFRQDLYYRLKVVHLHVPALRQRVDDILPLARELLGDSARRMKRDVSGFAPGVSELLGRYDWPGNVRELANAMERAVALAKGARVEVEDLPEELRALPSRSGHEINRVRRLEEVEREYILAALAFNQGNQKSTAQQLGIGTATLYRKLKLYRASPLTSETEALTDELSGRASSRPPALPDPRRDLP